MVRAEWMEDEVVKLQKQISASRWSIATLKTAVLPVRELPEKTINLNHV